jgi:hypothetical protein
MLCGAGGQQNKITQARRLIQARDQRKKYWILFGVE